MRLLTCYLAIAMISDQERSRHVRLARFFLLTAILLLAFGYGLNSKVRSQEKEFKQLLQNTSHQLNLLQQSAEKIFPLAEEIPDQDLARTLSSVQNFDQKLDSINQLFVQLKESEALLQKEKQAFWRNGDILRVLGFLCLFAYFWYQLRSLGFLKKYQPGNASQTNPQH